MWPYLYAALISGVFLAMILACCWVANGKEKL